MANRSKGREFLESILGKVREFDEGYSRKISRMYGKEGERTARNVLGAVLGGAPSFSVDVKGREGAEGLEKFAEVVIPTSIAAVSAVPKYVLPATGVTLAGKALYDLAQLLGDGQTDSELRM